MDEPQGFERLPAQTPEQQKLQIAEQLDNIQKYVEDQCADKQGYYDESDRYRVKSETRYISSGRSVDLDITRHDDGTTAHTINVADDVLEIGSDGLHYMNNDGSRENDHRITQIDQEDATLDDIVNNPQLTDFVQGMASAAEEAKLRPKEYAKHLIPESIKIKRIDDLLTVWDKVNKDLYQPGMAGILRPAFEAQTDTGDSWFMTKPMLVDEGRTFVGLYREDPDTKLLNPYFVYTSRSQGVWRALPRITTQRARNGAVSDLYDKGVAEEALNLPISLQKALWEYTAEQQIPLHDGSSRVESDIRTITNKTYDYILAGGLSERVRITEGHGSRATHNLAMLPEQTDAPDVAFSFDSVDYGNVDASIVMSRDQSIRYLVLKNQAGNQWVGMTEVVGAKMLDSFIVDAFVPGSVHAATEANIYHPPKEYTRMIDKESSATGYSDNTARSAGNIAIRALQGKL